MTPKQALRIVEDVFEKEMRRYAFDANMYALCGSKTATSRNAFEWRKKMQEALAMLSELSGMPRKR